MNRIPLYRDAMTFRFIGHLRFSEYFSLFCTIHRVPAADFEGGGEQRSPIS